MTYQTVQVEERLKQIIDGIIEIRISDTQEIIIKIKKTLATESYGNTSSKPKQLFFVHGDGLCQGKKFQVYAHLKLQKMKTTCKQF